MNIIKRLLKRSESYVLLIVIIFSAFITVINPAFLTLENLLTFYVVAQELQF